MRRTTNSSLDFTGKIANNPISKFEINPNSEHKLKKMYAVAVVLRATDKISLSIILQRVLGV